MPTKPQLKFTAWSYSRYQDYVRCPLYAKLKHLDKRPVEQGAAMGRGDTIHKEAEAWTMGKLKKLPESLENFKDEFKDLRKVKGVQCEVQWAISASWDKADWFGPTAWCRLKVDAWHVKGKVLTVIDHKTGKIYPDHPEQLHLYGAAGFALFPDVEKVRAELWYLDQGETNDRDYERGQFGDMKKLWEDRVRPMFADRQFAPRPNDKCRFCDFRKERGGPCKY